MGGTGRTLDADLSLSAGDKQNTFRFGVDYHRETSILIHSGADQRSAFQFNYNHKSQDQKFGISLTSSYTYVTSNLISVGGSVAESPNAPPVLNAQGLPNWDGWNPVATNLGNWAVLLQPYKASTGFQNSSLIVNYQLFKGLNVTSQIGYLTFHGSQSSLFPLISLYPGTNPKSQAIYSYSNGSNFIFEPQIQYERIIGARGKLTAMIGSSIQSVKTDGNYENGTGFANDNLLGSVNNAATITGGNKEANYKYAATFARLNYNWDDKYILNLSGRRDGSSRFGEGNQFSNFGAVGAAWIFTQENFFKSYLRALSFGKIRGSYGLTGSDNIPDYGYLTRWSTNGNIPYLGVAAFQPRQHANPSLRWQSNYKLEVALNLGFFHDRLTTELVFYRNRCGNQLVGLPLSNITGFSSVFANSPALVQNKGWEMTWHAIIVETKKFDWSTDINIGINHNKLISYPNLSQSPYASVYTIGKSLNIQRLLHLTGVDPQTGQFSFEDKNHDGQITADYNKGNNDLYDKDLAPDYEGGIQTDFRLKQFHLNLFFYFIKRQILNPIYINTPGLIEVNQSVQVLDRWQKPGDIARFARFTTQQQPSDVYFGMSDGVYTDGSYLSLKNASLSYDLNGSLIKKGYLKKISIFLRGQNLFKLTKLDGADPESGSITAMPIPRVFVGGIQIDL